MLSPLRNSSALSRLVVLTGALFCFLAYGGFELLLPLKLDDVLPERDAVDDPNPPCLPF
jgi:hypothetical protein